MFALLSRAILSTVAFCHFVFFTSAKIVVSASLCPLHTAVATAENGPDVLEP